MNLKEAIHASPGPERKKDYFILYLKAFFMGIADLIPGVSGGTIAFITGIYEPLINAITSFNKKFFTSLLSFKLVEAISVVHIRFVVIVAFGILSAMFSLAHLMHYLLTSHPIPTWASFFGLILASIIVIIRHLPDPKSFKSIRIILMGTVFAYAVVSLVPVNTPQTYWFIYLCGIIGITAMLLPGISGSFLLLILGKYAFITSALKNPFYGDNIYTLIVFVSGSITGMVCFSRVLKYFMTKHHDSTIAFLTGILIGSLKKVWPWKEVLETEIVRGKVRVLREANILPSNYNGEFFLSFALIIACFIIVLYIEKISNDKRSRVSSAG